MKFPWFILFIALVIYALIFLAAKYYFKVDTRWMIADITISRYLSNDHEATKSRNLKKGDTENKKP